jgi:uncharacterized protein YciI
MFIFSLTYTVPLDQVDALLPDHLAWLNAGRTAGQFMAWGRKVPRSGGMIFAQVDSRAEAEALCCRRRGDRGGYRIFRQFCGRGA